MTQTAIGTTVDAPVDVRSIVNPATGGVIDTVAEQGPDAVDAAVASALAAFDGGAWPAMVRSERARLLLRIADAVEEDNERLFVLETLNNGRPMTETRAQLARFSEWFRYNAGLLVRRSDRSSRCRAVSDLSASGFPSGCGHHQPFNHPLLILARSLSAALATAIGSCSSPPS